MGSRIATGKVVIMYALDGRDGSHDGTDFRPGDVLVTDMTDPDWEPIMKKASAIVTNKGGRTCHAAIIARELGVPAIVGTGNATELLKENQLVTVSCCEGEAGFVYDGEVPFRKIETDLGNLPDPSVPIMLNVASPELAFKYSHIPNAGVGLAREEFIINNYIQVHPLALLHHRMLGDRELSEKICKLITGYESEESFFINKLSFGIGKIAAAFYPNKVIVRFSDFKTNEYKNLLGGSYYEPDEENPMIGWRGASRYYSQKYRHAFGMECQAIRKVREVMGLSNVVVMIPFCRTVKELLMVYEVMRSYGLERGKDGLEVYLMAEIPSNILLADEFADHIDGFSIGSNDLTQLTLGLDRDSSLVAELYDERNPAVKIGLADPYGSALHNWYTDGELRAEGTSISEGIGQGRVTANLEGLTIDRAYRISDEEMLLAIYDLTGFEGVVMGGSTGINVAGAIRMAKDLGPGHTIVTLLCDHGQRYQSKVFNPAFLREKGLPVPPWLD